MTFEGLDSEKEPFVRMRIGAEESEEKPRVLLALGDAGSAQYIAAVLPRLQELFTIEVACDTKGAAQSVLERDTPLAPLSGPIQMRDYNLVLCGTAGKAQATWRWMTENARTHGVPCLWFGDFFGSGSEADVRDLDPDWMALFDETSKQRFQALHPSVPEERLAVIGNPSFDAYVGEFAEERQGLRSKLGISEGERLVAYAASSFKQFDLQQSLDALLPWVRERGMKFSLTFHPADMVADSGRVANIREHVRASLASPERFVDTHRMASGDVSLAADMVVTDYSTEGVRAAVMGVPTVFFMPHRGPGSAQAYQESRGGERPFFPILEQGGPATGIFTVEDVPSLGTAIPRLYRGTIRESWNDSRFRMLADGRASQRFLELISRITREANNTTTREK